MCSVEYYAQTLPDPVSLLTFHFRSPKPDIPPPTSSPTAERRHDDHSPSEADVVRVAHAQIQRRIRNIPVGSLQGRSLPVYTLPRLPDERVDQSASNFGYELHSLRPSITSSVDYGTAFVRERFEGEHRKKSPSPHPS